LSGYNKTPGVPGVELYSLFLIHGMIGLTVRAYDPAIGVALIAPGIIPCFLRPGINPALVPDLAPGSAFSRLRFGNACHAASGTFLLAGRFFVNPHFSQLFISCENCC